MKDIKNYNAEKYGVDGAGSIEYKRVDDGIFETKSKDETLFVTSLSFVQEPELGEDKTAESISQYPLEDILDKFYCHVSDFYEDLNVEGSETCYLEFASDDKEDIINLRSIIGKHVFNKEANGIVELVIDSTHVKLPDGESNNPDMQIGTFETEKEAIRFATELAMETVDNE